MRLRSKIRTWYCDHFGFGILYGVEAAVAQVLMLRKMKGIDAS